MEKAINETNRRREIQQIYNQTNNLKPLSITKEIREVISLTSLIEEKSELTSFTKEDLKKQIKIIEKEMLAAAKNYEFEKAAELRDILFELKAL